VELLAALPGLDAAEKDLIRCGNAQALLGA
jgi:hypothetical protein